jgi:hypothetical protein
MPLAVGERLGPYEVVDLLGAGGTTNLPFSEWTTVFPNPRLCKALLDRVSVHGTQGIELRRDPNLVHGIGGHLIRSSPAIELAH